MTRPTGSPRGRRPLPPAERRSVELRAYVRPAEGAELAAWAAREGRPLAELLVEAALREARASAGAGRLLVEVPAPPSEVAR